MPLPNLKLISFAICPYVQRARIVLNEKNIPHELEYIDLEAPPPWFYDISPLEKVPVLLADNRAVFESSVICEYLDEISENSLHPKDPLEKAYCRSWMEFGNDLLSLTYNYVTSNDAQKCKQLKATLLDRLDILEDEIGDKKYFLGEKFSLVDAVFGPLFRFHLLLQQTYTTNFFEETAMIKKWSSTLLEHPSVVNSVPDSYAEDMIVYLKKQEAIVNKPA